MGSGLLLETISVWRDPSKCRPPHLLRWNPLLQPPQPQFLAVGARKPIGFPLRCTTRPPSVTAEKKKDSPLGAALRFVLDTLDRLKKPAAAIVLLAFLLTVDPCGALAASGGRMGGTAFSSSSSRSHSASSWSYSDPPVSSFSSYSAPYYTPSPFGGGLYVGPAFGVGFGPGSGFFLLMMGFVAVILLSGFLPDRADDGSVLTATQRTSVIKLQVGLLDTARSFQKDLDQIAEAADTSTAEGLNCILTETTLALLRHPDCCISAYYSVDIKRSIDDGEKCFNQLSIEERGKFDEETLVNVNNIRRQKTSKKTFKSFSNGYIVITILVAAEGVYRLPVINGSGDLKEALQKLGSIPCSKTLAVEVLWTPQDENDTLSERELLEDYPFLRPL
ncbi:hypothetical protein MUK42_26012 [Musa troglodytarum]|uniref:Myelin-associated oligodendrocyte basic protein n=1 Tax=Musa troglodytarum TaxID=320322 RepID=A0A9E7EFB2_9LILI|nr:hypothetical protein MUK42_26012 [Musa troglodytarum]